MDYENWNAIVRDGESMVSSDEVVINDLTPNIGGNIVCSFIPREKDVHIIASSQVMLEALENLENDNNQIPEKAWNMVQSAIILARNK